MYYITANPLRRLVLVFLTLYPLFCIYAQQVDYSVVYVREESGLDFRQVTTDNDYVCMPIVRRTVNSINWLTNRIIDISIDGSKIAYLSARNNTTNIFIKDINRQGSSVQRTNRSAILDFSYSPDGKYICFSETSGKVNQLYQTDANKGYVCRQLTSANSDYSPVYSKDMSQVFFARQELNSISIWSYNIRDNFLSSFSTGFNPNPTNEEGVVICVRPNGNGKNEIWRINYLSGTEECIVSDINRSFSTPCVSPDGNWICFVGENNLNAGNTRYVNTDIFVCKLDGTQFTQLTYHAADDLSPVWSRDGKYIYFISQRGSTNAVANIWRINFLY